MNIYHNPTYRVVSILNLISQQNNLTFTDISNILNISKSTLQPILKTLVDLDYLVLNNDNRTYRIGINAYKIGKSYLNNNDTLDTIKLFMKKIVLECNEICQLGIHDNSRPGNVFYIAKEEPIQSITLISSIGTSLPAYATALGKCLLGGFSKDELRKIYPDKLEKLTKNTIDNLEDLINMVEKVKNNGYSFESEESSIDVECIAVPINHHGKIVAAMSVSIPKYRSNNKKIETIKKILLKQASNLEHVLMDHTVTL